MKFTEKKVKVFLVTLAVMILVTLEFGILDNFRFTNNLETYSSGLTLTIKNLNKDLGWNYIVMSMIVLLLYFVWAFYMGYKRNPWGLAAMVLFSLSPFIGMAVMFNVFYGWGTAYITPFMYILGLTTATRAVQLIFFAVVTVIYPVLWFAGKAVRKVADAK